MEVRNDAINARQVFSSITMKNEPAYPPGLSATCAMFDHKSWTDQSVKKRFKNGAVPRTAGHGEGIVVDCKFHRVCRVVGDIRTAGKGPGMMANRPEQHRAGKAGGQDP